MLSEFCIRALWKNDAVSEVRTTVPSFFLYSHLCTSSKARPSCGRGERGRAGRRHCCLYKRLPPCVQCVMLVFPAPCRCCRCTTCTRGACAPTRSSTIASSWVSGARTPEGRTESLGRCTHKSCRYGTAVSWRFSCVCSPCSPVHFCVVLCFDRNKIHALVFVCYFPPFPLLFRSPPSYESACPQLPTP